MLLVTLALGAAATPAAARIQVADVRGSIGVGYTKMFTDFSPAGSISTALGLTVPINARFSVGPTVAYHLLGSRTVERGSLLASVDYSAFEVGVLGHWKPQGWGPIALISGGPEIISARGELSTTGGGAAFSDLAVHRTSGAGALNVTLMQSRERPVRVGLELSARRVFIGGWQWNLFRQSGDWKLLTGRLVFHY